MKTGGTKRFYRRRPRQRRAQQTVDAILDAVVRVLKREGLDAVTTNRVAEVAGVSVGSLYQYFPDKQAIFVALHRRHLDEIDRVIEAKLLEYARSSLNGLIRALIRAMIDAHSSDPELYELLATEVPHRADGTRDFAVRLASVFRLALSSRAQELRKGYDLDRLVFTVANMVDSLSHAALFRRPPRLSLAAAEAEVARAVLAYLHS